jgi:hypothetical protein
MPVVALEVAAADGTGPTRRRGGLVSVAVVVVVVLRAVAGAVLEATVTTYLVSPALHGAELAQTAVAEARLTHMDPTVVAMFRSMGSATRGTLVAAEGQIIHAFAGVVDHFTHLADREERLTQGGRDVRESST